MKNIKKLIIVILVLFGGFLYSNVDNTENLYYAETETAQYLSTGIMYDGAIEQTIVPTENILDGISMKSSVVGDCTNVSISYCVENMDGEIVAEGTASAKDIKNNKFYKFAFPQIQNCKDKEYIFKIEENGATEENGIVFYIDPFQTKYDLKVRGDSAEGSLVAKMISHRFDLKTFIIVMIFVLYLSAFTKILYKLFK